MNEFSSNEQLDAILHMTRYSAAFPLEFHARERLSPFSPFKPSITSIIHLSLIGPPILHLSSPHQPFTPQHPNNPHPTIPPSNNSTRNSLRRHTPHSHPLLLFESSHLPRFAILSSSLLFSSSFLFFFFLSFLFSFLSLSLLFSSLSLLSLLFVTSLFISLNKLQTTIFSIEKVKNEERERKRERKNERRDAMK